ncbi:MAG TPA: cytochrome c biogenesis protein CcdA [Steroidobacteraceae bacterium]|nr:cytochrome c biogenesis protein CcdA [Steroidobacteraceae bacterium]
MTILVVAFIGGVLAIASPCILPVLPFVFARAGHSFRRGGLPLLAGMALTFALVGSVAGLAGGWVVRANQLGRGIAMVVFVVLGLTLLIPSAAEFLSRPLVRLGAVLQRRGVEHTTTGGSVLLGVSTGLLWAPCAGPILGLILAGVALEGPGAGGAFLLLAFAGGAASALALGLLAGKGVFRALKRGLGAEVWMRRGLGLAVLASVAVIAMGWDTGMLTRLSLTTIGTATELEQKLVARVRPVADPAAISPSADILTHGALTTPQPRSEVMPPLDGAVQWINGPAQTRDELRGNVVLINFWTYSCINCLRAIPYVQAWARRYTKTGLVVIGVHTPEFAFEREPRNVSAATRRLQLSFAIAVDSSRTIWTAFRNQYWPALYVVDTEGRIRYHHFGEGRYDHTERVIQALLAERNAEDATGSRLVHIAATGVQAPSDPGTVETSETYVGYERQDNYASPQPIAKDQVARYTPPMNPRANHWGLAGQWAVGREHATLTSSGGRIVFRFHARDLHVVLAPRSDGTPVRFRVSLDGRPPLENRGVDVDPKGWGVVIESRLYQLIRQREPIEDRTFEVEFLDPGVQAFVFTFG